MNKKMLNNYSVVVFAKNEEGNLHFLLDELLQKISADKIIFVLDGDIEPTVNVLISKNIKYLNGANNGKGAAIRSAIKSIDSEVLVFMDADGSHDPNEIDGLLNPLADEDVKMVIASRFLGGSEELDGNMPNKVRCIGNIVGNFIINTIWNRSGVNISDAQNGFRSIQRSAFLNLGIEENSFSVEQEMVIKCLKKGFKICEVPSFERKRKSGKSHISYKHLICYVGCLFKNLVY